MAVLIHFTLQRYSGITTALADPPPPFKLRINSSLTQVCIVKLLKINSSLGPIHTIKSMEDYKEMLNSSSIKT